MAGDGQRLPLDLVNHLGRFVDVLRSGTSLNQKISLLGTGARGRDQLRGIRFVLTRCLGFEGVA